MNNRSKQLSRQILDFILLGVLIYLYTVSFQHEIKALSDVWNIIVVTSSLLFITLVVGVPIYRLSVKLLESILKQKQQEFQNEKE